MRHKIENNKEVMYTILSFFACFYFAHQAFAENIDSTETLVSEDANILHQLTPAKPELVDRVILGSPKDSAIALLEATQDDTMLFTYLEPILQRLSDCKEMMDPDIFIRDINPAKWRRLQYSFTTLGVYLKDRRYQILMRLADCIREATPSIERKNARKLLFSNIGPYFYNESYQISKIAGRAVIYDGSGSIKSQTGWEDLLDFFDKIVFSDKLTDKQVDQISSVYHIYCLQYPDKEQAAYFGTSRPRVSV